MISRENVHFPKGIEAIEYMPPEEEEDIEF